MDNQLHLATGHLQTYPAELKDPHILYSWNVTEDKVEYFHD